MPTQSLAQKTPKLKSIVQRVPATKNYQDLPYKSLETDPREFIRYIIGLYDTEIRCLATFYSHTTILACHVIAATITTLVAANRGVHFLVSLFPRELMNSLANPMDAELPGPPALSDNYQMEVRIYCSREWTDLMCLLQYWYDASSVYTYGGPIRQERKLMLLVFYRINAMLNPYIRSWTTQYNAPSQSNA